MTTRVDKYCVKIHWTGNHDNATNYITKHKAAFMTRQTTDCVVFRSQQYHRVGFNTTNFQKTDSRFKSLCFLSANNRLTRNLVVVQEPQENRGRVAKQLIQAAERWFLPQISIKLNRMPPLCLTLQRAHKPTIPALWLSINFLSEFEHYRIAQWTFKMRWKNFRLARIS